MQTYHRLATILAAVALLSTLAPAQQSNLDKVLAQMDQTSAKFQSEEANFIEDDYTRAVRDTSHQYGVTYFQRKGGSLQMGARYTDQAGKKVVKIVQYQSGMGDIFDPNLNQVDEFNSRGHQAMTDTFLTLGFGASGRDLDKAWTITDQGSESITLDGQTVKTEKLDLVSKDADVRKQFSHITLWIDPARAISLKQQFFQPAGDYKLMTYSHIRYNASVNMQPYAISKKATVVKH
jgi:outer membrane lipoprotein-sorting protein